MPELPTTPFPELHALDQKRPVPTLADLLGRAAGFPAPPPAQPRSPQSRVPLPHLPAAVQDPQPPPPDNDEPALGEMPVADSGETLRETLAALTAEDFRPATGQPPAETPAEPRDSGLSPAQADSQALDEELAEAFRPIVQSSLAKALSSTEAGLQAFLEPMLRSTVRRAIAEQMEASGQFKPIGAFDRLGFRLLALLTCRSYEDIIFHRTRRYQVEEVYLLRRRTQSLISYASNDPARHVSPRRVQGTVRALASKLQAPDGTIESTFDLPERRLALVRQGEYCLLVAVLRGRTNAIVRADLDYVLRQVEERFGERLEQKSEAFLIVLQPLLEGCLLIQSPAPPH